MVEYSTGRLAEFIFLVEWWNIRPGAWQNYYAALRVGLGIGLGNPTHGTQGPQARRLFIRAAQTTFFLKRIFSNPDRLFEGC